MAINQFFNRGLNRAPDAPCLVDASVSRTYREVGARRLAVAAGLAGLGVRRGERCGVLSANCVAAFEAILAVYAAGLVYVPLNVNNVVSANVAIAGNCDVSVLFFQSAHRAAAEEVRNACPAIRLLICLDDADGFERLAATAASAPEVVNDPHDTVSIYSTGGTTGAPKGVEFSELTWDTMAANMFAALPKAAPYVYLIVSPLTHAAGTMGLLLLAVGATMVIQDGFDAEAVLQAIARQRITHLYLPPTAIYKLLAHPGVETRDYSSLKCFIYSAAPMAVDKLKRCLAVFGPVMMQFWGQTEAPIFCTHLGTEEHDIDDQHGRLASCGRPMLLTEVAVMDDAGNLLPDNQRGELVVRGNLVMLRYHKNEKATIEAGAHGWHHTGDVGYRDQAGYYFIVDRKKDMIISGGYNVYPNEVEQVILSHPAVVDCAVIGVPHDVWGEQVTAILTLQPGAAVEPDDIIALCKRMLGSVYAPKQVEIWADLPRTAVGKVDKRSIRDGFWAGRARAI